MSTECSACGAYTESVSEGLKHADDCPYIEIAELQAALDEANARNREVASLIIENDRTEAVKWAKGLVSSFDHQYQVRVDDAAPAAAKAVEMDAQDAARYRWLRTHTGAGQSMPGCPVAFRLPEIPLIRGVNLMKSSVSQHLDAAIDAALSKQGGSQ